MSYLPIIGLEIHVELKTKSKMFCGCCADYFGRKPNTYTCPVCLGLPGALPVPNKEAILWCLKLGLSLNCEIPLFSKFDRKNYFYPDLPKGYQISQYDSPFAKNGFLEIEGKKIRIRRVHLEEDTGKLIHTKINGENCTLIDFNRSGVPLVEIVTEPDIRDSKDAKNFLQELQLIIRYLQISDADMEKGSMRLEPNISVQEVEKDNKKNLELPDYKVEVKNINSFNFVKRAIDYEIERQIGILKSGKKPKQETRGWDEKRGITYPQRVKEEAHDYRYFPEPDIPPFVWRKEEVEKLKNKLTELPAQKRRRYIKEFSLKETDARILTEDTEKANFFEKSIEIVRQINRKGEHVKPQDLANWIINKKISIKKNTPENLVRLILEKQKKPEVSLDILNQIIDKVIAQNKKAVKDYQKGKKQALMFLVGSAMRLLRGKADANTVRECILKRIK